MIVYGDLLFLINFSMDFLCFYLSCLLLHQRLPTLRALLASCVGGIYSVVALFLDVDGVTALLVDGAVLVVMCMTVYTRRKMRLTRMLCSVALYFFVSALLGGIMTALFSLFNRMDIFAEGLDMGDGVDVWLFALLAIVSCIFSLKGGRMLTASSNVKRATLLIEDEGGCARLEALVDSGNLATEPISGKSVIFASISACAKALGDDTYTYLNSSNDMTDMPPSLSYRIRLVPSRTVSGEALLPAIRMKSTTLIFDGRRKDLDAYIAFVPKETVGGCDAIISNELII